MVERSTGRSILLWVVAVVITLASAAYQRMTGPSYPVKGELTLDGVPVSYLLPTTHDSGIDAGLGLRLPTGYRGILEWQRVNSRDRWQRLIFMPEGDSLGAAIPQQPPAGKVRYRVVIDGPHGERYSLTEQPVVIRFKGAVPLAVLIPHVCFMFFSMLFAARTGLQTLVRNDRPLKLAVVTTILLFIGGLILGPIVQKYAFGAYWTGWPFGKDLTDNKTAFAFLFWIIALWRSRGGRNARGWFITATIVHFAVYLIPHSVLGSELDYTESAPGE